MPDRAGVHLAARVHLRLIYAFLYIPILVLMVLSLNRAGLPTAWTGFSLKWYGVLAESPAIVSAVRNTLVVAVSATVISSILGTLLAMGAERMNRSSTLDALLFAPMIIPDIVLAIALLSFFTLLNFTLGLHSIIEASEDLGAGRFTTFRRITLPVIFPGVLAGALLAFTLSIDEFIIAFFTAGPGESSTTLPMRIYAMIRFGVTPEINAMATIVMFVSFALVLLSQRIDRGSTQP